MTNTPLAAGTDAPASGDGDRDGKTHAPAPQDFATTMQRLMIRFTGVRALSTSLVAIPALLIAVGAAIRALTGPTVSAVVAVVLVVPYVALLQWSLHQTRRGAQHPPATDTPVPSTESSAGSPAMEPVPIDWGTAQAYTRSALDEIAAATPQAADLIERALATLQDRTGAAAAYLYIVGCLHGRDDCCRWSRMGATVFTMLRYPVLCVSDLLITQTNDIIHDTAEDTTAMGPEGLGFLLAHELEHAWPRRARIQRWRNVVLAFGWLPLSLLSPPVLLPVLVPALWAVLNLASQVEELVCDRAALRVVPSGGVRVFGALAAVWETEPALTRWATRLVRLLRPGHPPFWLRAHLAARAATRAAAQRA